MSASPGRAPLPVKILAGLLTLLGVFAFLGSIVLWGQGFILTFPAGVDYRFRVTDLLVNVPATLLAAAGLWQMRRYGYVAAQFTAGFYVYASVEIFVDVAQKGPPYPAEIIGPQALAVLIAGVLVFYLWRIQEMFR